MGAATYAIPSFIGGEISKFAQGRFDKPDYRVSMNVCLNSFPVEMGAWVRRPGSMHASATRRGARGRVVKFDFEQANPYTIEFTDGHARFRNGAALATTNDAQVILSVSSATPAVVETGGLHGWATGDTVMFPAPGPSPLLEARQFTVTVVDASHISIADSITGLAINGSTLTPVTTGSLVSRVQDIATIYTSGSWANLRSIQAQTTALLLNGVQQPQTIVAAESPAGNDAVFTIDATSFIDGPYLDQVGGSLVTPSGISGIVTLTLSAQLYYAQSAYKKGDLVTNSGITYRSRRDTNVNNTPASSPTYWERVSPGVAVGPNGFLPSDVGRLLRLYNPALAAGWNNATTYNVGDLVQNNGGIGYQSLVGNNINNTPSASSSFWKVFMPGWTWAKVTSISTAGLISGNLAGAIHIGSMLGAGGLNAGFDGNTNKNHIQCAGSIYVTAPDGLNHYVYDYIGQNYTASGAQAISSVILYPASNTGFLYLDGQRAVYGSTFNLRAKSSAPANSSDGTLLATLGIDAHNTITPVTLVSNDSVTTWNYVWVEVATVYVTQLPGSPVVTTVEPCFAQVQFFGPSGIVGTAVSAEILGAPLPNTASMAWRLGAYSDTSGWPTCGCYHEGRIWLSGAIPNRFDASVSNGVSGSTIDFTPTAPAGTVSDSNAITAVVNSDGVNPIFWMDPDLQGIIIGTQAGEFLVQAPTNGPITPTNIAARRVTKIGCANVEPRRTEHTSVFVQRFGQKLVEYFADVYSGKFSAPNLADKAQHITRATISELAYQQATTPIIWGRGADGSLFGCTYKRDALASAQGPTYNGWHRHAFGSGRVVESICSGPSDGGSLDTLTMVTNDAAANIRHVELLTDTMDEETPVTDVCFLDNSVTPTSTSSTLVASGGAPYGGMTMNGLWHLNGKTVQVFAGGLDLGFRGISADLDAVYTDFVVTNGSIFVPYGDGISAGPGGGLFTPDLVASFATFPIAVGFTFTSRGQLVRPIAPADTGARNGPALGKTRRNHRYAILLQSTRGISIGTTFDAMRPANFLNPDNSPVDPTTTFSGVHQDSLDDDYSFDGMVCWEISRPEPASVVAISGNLQTQDQ